MKKLGLFILLLTVCISCNQPQENWKNEVALFNENWAFTLDSTSNQWTQITVPHTPQLEPLVILKQWQGNCWYQKKWEITELDQKKHFLEFEGVMHEATFWLNGKKIFHHQGGYTPFVVDLNTAVQKGENHLVVKVNNEDNGDIPPGKTLETLDFNFYGGIYRNVHYKKIGSVHITDAILNFQDKNSGYIIHFKEVSKDLAQGFVQAEIANQTETNQKVQLKVIFAYDGKTVETFESDWNNIAKNSKSVIKVHTQITKPKLWDVVKPNLHEVTIQIWNENKQLVHEEKESIGIRKFELKEDGFYLNNQPMFLQGTNRHQEYPYVGYAISDEANYRDAYKIKQAGFDFVRLSHYPHSTSFMKACDALGLITMNCISGWQYYGGEKFVENSIKEIQILAKRDRNRTSVAFWEVSLNESEMPDAYMEKANQTLRESLFYQKAITAGWIDHPSYDLFIPARQHAKPPMYWNHYEKGNRKILIAEYGDWEYYAQNAGFNQTAFADLQPQDRSSRQLRSAGEKRLLQQAFNYQEAFNSNLKGKHTIGHANWLMFDYNRGYAPDLESSGISDIFRIPKFAHYFYQSQRDLSKFPNTEPTLFIANYWNDVNTKTITVFSNLEEIALYINEELLERKRPTINSFSDQLLHPPFVFEIKQMKPGVIKAIGFKNGKAIKEQLVKTPETPKQIQLELDLSNKHVSNTNQDYLFVYAKIVDQNQTLVPDATNKVSFTIQGAEIIGPNEVNAEAGIATILVKTNPRNETFSIEASAKGLAKGKILQKKITK